ncbi:hypothetical protein SAMN04488504_10962 [Myxococcus virescens]|uniref:Uncharacterized protein n=1 Tax=Myxococcus virescens TaxID=83456 RepID=A0ABY0MVV3_9BACT|nr:hypothetical protein SAMN04488504_10962 [Myxococcus virescens]
MRRLSASRALRKRIWAGVEAFLMKERGWAWFSKLRGTDLLPGRLLFEPIPPESPEGQD